MAWRRPSFGPLVYLPCHSLPEVCGHVYQTHAAGAPQHLGLFWEEGDEFTVYSACCCLKVVVEKQEMNGGDGGTEPGEPPLVNQLQPQQAERSAGLT